MSIADQIVHMVMEKTANIRAERDTYRRQRDELAEAAIAVVVAWDNDEVGQIDGELIDTLRYAATIEQEDAK